MLETNREYFERLNIIPWHEAGYTGKRGVAATQEGWDTKRYNLRNQVAMGNPRLLSESAHPINTAKCFFEIAPDKKLIQLPYSVTLKNGLPVDIENSDFVNIVYKAIKTMKIDIMWGAMISPVNGCWLDKYLSKISPRFAYYMNISRDCGDGANRMLNSKYVHGVGSYYYNTETGLRNPASDKDDRADALTHVPMHLYIPYSNEDYGRKENSRKFYGASCAAPILAGMMSLVNDLFVEKTGVPLGSAEARRFIRDHSIKIGYNFSIFKLPNPEDVVVEDYVNSKLITIHDINDRELIKEDEEDAIISALNSGLMHLDNQGNFNPDSPVTNAQFAKMVLKILEREGSD